MSAENEPAVVPSAEQTVDLPKSVAEEPQLVTAEEPKPITHEQQKPMESKADEPKLEPSTDAVKPGTTAQVSAITTPMTRLLSELPDIIEQTGHTEMWGVELKDADHVPTIIVLEKFLRANNKDTTKAKAQLTEALNWRKKMDPLKLLAEREFDSEKFGNLGYVTVYETTEKHGKEIVTWNIYGAVKDKQKTFGDVEEFIRWRSALMELSVRELDLSSATEPIPDNGIDPYKMVQVHDYLNVSFLRMDPSIRAASKKVIETFSMAYPELLKEKFFVNVPIVMAWVFTTIKLFLSPETVKKFHPLSYGKSLAGELPSIGEELPEEYGGKGRSVKDGLAVKYAGSATATSAAPATATAIAIA